MRRATDKIQGRCVNLYDVVSDARLLKILVVCYVCQYVSMYLEIPIFRKLIISYEVWSHLPQDKKLIVLKIVIVQEPTAFPLTSQKSLYCLS